jgi:hypothetical protein
MKNILFAFSIALLSVSCGGSNTEVDEEDKKKQLENLELIIVKYSDAADDVCKCLEAEKDNECDKLIESGITLRKAIKAPLLLCLDKKYLSIDEYHEANNRIKAIDEKGQNCINDRTERIKYGIELHQENPENAESTETESSTPKKDASTIKKTIKVPVPVVEEEEEHHHDEPY